MSTSLVWITGASTGIGAALAATVPFPADVINVARSAGPIGQHLAADLATSEGWDRVAEDFHARLDGFSGSLAILISNAGVLDPIGFAGSVDPQAYRHNVLLNSAAPQILGDAFLRAVRASGFAGAVVVCQLTSGAASTPYPGWSGYGAGKAAGDQWVRAVGLEQEQTGSQVKVVAIAPGVVATRMQEKIRRAAERDFPAGDRFRRLHAEGRLDDPEAAARRIWAVLEADPANGAVLDVRNNP